MKSVKEAVLFLMYFLQAPASMVLLVAGLYWFTDGISGLARGATALEKDKGIFYFVVGIAVCGLALRLMESAFTDPYGGRDE